MTGWNEDNFIEKIIPLLGRRFNAAPCPKVAAFLTPSDGGTGGVLKKATAEHASGCADCGDLQQRFERFDAPMVIDHDGEWAQTEKRLDNWLESFLASGAGVRHEGDRIRASRLRVVWERLTEPTAVRQSRWVLVPAATLALVICSFLAGQFSVRRPPQVTAEVASLNRSAANMASPQTVVEQRAADRRATGESQVSQPPQPQPEAAAGAAIASGAHVRIGPSTASPSAPHNLPRPTDIAVLALLAPSKPEKASSSSPLEPSQNPTGSLEPIYPSPGDRNVETAAASGSAPSIGPAGRGVLPSLRPAASAMRSLVISRGVAPAPVARTAPAPAIPTPAVIKLEAGTRVWISLKSIHPRAGGVSEFRGVVLLPVTQSGTTLLGRNTGVSGTMTVRNGKRSVQILEFLSAGAHYRLSGASGEASLRLLGAGEVVQFDAGRVLETWMAAVSTYEKQSGEPGPPE